MIRSNCFMVLLLLCNPCLAQTNVIFDTDIDSDVDDVQALAMLHAYEMLDKIKLLGVVVTSDEENSFRCVDAINTFYGKPNIPIGFLKENNPLRNFSKYTKEVSEAYAHDIGSQEDLIESAQLYRSLLVRSEDSSVVIVTVGHLTSLQNFLRSKGDEISPLSGKELAARKIKKWICMGGMYPEGKEANFYRPDPASTVYCLEHWDQDVIFCGWELGNLIITGGEYLKSELNEDDPVYRSYELYNGFAGRPAWDQVAVMLLDESTSERYFANIENGVVVVFEDGSNKWNAKQNLVGKKHSYLSIRPGVDADDIARTMDNLVLRLSEE